MYILSEGRVAFLDFLRNLTPQILLLSLAFVVGAKLDLARVDLGNWPQTLIFLSFLCLAVLSGIANATLFLSRFEPIHQVQRVFKQVERRCARKWRIKFTYAWKRKWVFLEAIFIMLVLELSIVATFGHAMTAALKMAT